jgi:hypothetical protein
MENGLTFPYRRALQGGDAGVTLPPPDGIGG